MTKAQDLLHRVETDCQDVGLYLNPKKTKYILVNSNDPFLLSTSNDNIIERVDDFTYLGGLIDIASDMNLLVGNAWGAVNALLPKFGGLQLKWKQR